MLDMKNMLPYDAFERMHPYGVTTAHCHVEVDEDTWFFIETYDPTTTEWEKVRLNFCNPKEVAAWIRKYYGWKEAAQFKRLARNPDKVVRLDRANSGWRKAALRARSRS